MQTLPSGIKKVETNDNATVANFNVNADLLDEKITDLDGHIGSGGAAHAVATTLAAGFMPAADKALINGATNAATANTLVQRDASGRFKAAAPSANDDVARKAETDAASAAAAAAQGTANSALPKIAGTSNPLTGDLYIRKDVARLAFDRPSGGVNPHVGLNVFDNGAIKGYLVWDYTLSKWVFIDGVGGQYEVITAKGGAMLGILRLLNDVRITATDTGGTGRNVAILATDNNLHLGDANINTFIYGASIVANSAILANLGVYMPNNVAVVAKDNAGTNRALLYVTPSNEMALGHTSLPVYVNSSVVPQWSNGSAIRALLHSGDGGTQTITGNLGITGGLTAFNILVSGTTGSEGGQIDLAKPASGTTLTGNVAIDTAGDALRIFENGGTARGVFVNLSDAPGSVGGELWHTGKLRNNNGVLELNVGGTWTPVGGVKGVQRGVYTLSGTSLAADITISAINLAKSYVILSQTTSPGGTQYQVYGNLTSTTNLNLRRATSSSGSDNIQIAWQVIESY